MSMDVVDNLIVSSRVRIARNLEGIPFKTKAKSAFDGVADTIRAKNRNFVSTKVADISSDMARALFEQHLISREFLDNKVNSIIVARNDNKVVVMLGEEDHIRIQSIQTGFDLKTAFDAAKKIADDVESEHEIAKRDAFGYLTCCPTNLGTGMRVSVMMFLPALTITNQMGHIIKQLGTQHITVRGVYGEGSLAVGYMYQVSNQACFSMDAEKVIETVRSVTMQLGALEIKTQKALMKDSADSIIDRVMRAWGILTHAHMLSSNEGVELLAVLKLGVCLNIINFKNPRVLDDLFFVTQPNTLITVDERANTLAARDKIRASRVAEVLRASRI